MAQNFKHDYEYIRQHLKSLEFLCKKLSNSLENFEEFFAKIFTIIMRAGLRYCSKKDKIKFLEEAYESYKRLELTNQGKIDLIQLEEQDFYKIINKIKTEEKRKILGFLPLRIVESKKGKTKYYLFNRILFLTIEKY